MTLGTYSASLNLSYQMASLSPDLSNPELRNNTFSLVP